ncbi:uncharacterized protein LOC136037998 [Artemia franciscana]|uniref:uncharacterized protein LOC136037998 n=1 Tax=Artemia franciscana TaxID=6661 RepID=UPI0032DA9D53
MGDSMQSKIKALKECYQELQNFFEREERLFARNVALENQILEFGTTLSKLQKALSDTQGQLNYEQTVAKQLQIENQYIQYKLKEQEKAIRVLSHLLGVEKADVQSVIKNQDIINFTKSKDKKEKEQNFSESPARERAEPTVTESSDSPSLEDVILSKRLEEMRNLAKEMCGVFLRDRELIQEEREVERKFLSEKITKLNDQLLSTQEELRHISQKYANLRVGEVTTAKAWENEKTMLLKKIKELPNVSDNEDIQILIEGLITALDTKKYTYCVVNLKKELKELKLLVEEATTIAEQYRSKSTTLQKQLRELKYENDETVSKAKGENESLKSQLRKALERCQKSDEKTKMELAGYKNEISLLKDELRRAEKKLYFLTLRQAV